MTQHALNTASAELVRKTAELRLNKAYESYKSVEPWASDAFALLVLVFLFEFEITTEVASIVRNVSPGFAGRAAMKGLIHRLFEYDQTLHRHVIRKFEDFGAVHAAPVDIAAIKAEKKKWKSELAQLRSWSDLRNETTGHYGADIARQIQLLDEIEFKNILGIAGAFLTFNHAVVEILGASLTAAIAVAGKKEREARVPPPSRKNV